MRRSGSYAALTALIFLPFVATLFAQRGETPPAGTPASGDDPIKALVGRLDVERYKATIKGLTQFGDRRQGTDRNRAAVDWIDTQLKGYGCPTNRITYEYHPPDNQGRGRGAAAGGRGPDQAQGGGRLRGIRTRTGVNTDPMAQSDVKLR